SRCLTRWAFRFSAMALPRSPGSISRASTGCASSSHQSSTVWERTQSCSRSTSSPTDRESRRRDVRRGRFVGRRRVAAGAGSRGPELHMAVDAAKDQSYMLYHLDRERLSRIVFPLGGMSKREVRQHALEFGLPVANKAESQEICFVPRGQTAAYLARRLPVRA